MQVDKLGQAVPLDAQATGLLIVLLGNVILQLCYIQNPCLVVASIVSGSCLAAAGPDQLTTDQL